MKTPERTVAGLRCSQVLADLSAYLDGDLTAERARHIEEHLRGCDVCERFGGEFAAVIRSLKTALADPEPLPEEIAQRLRRRLQAEIG